jgi:hypothetical protein
MTDTFWTSWGIVGSNESAQMYDDVMSVPGMNHDAKRGIPIFHGTLDEFAKHFAAPFEVHNDGRFIKVSDTEDV